MKMRISRGVRVGSNAVVYSLVVLAALVVIQILSQRHQKLWDLTMNQRYSLAPQTRSILRSLKENVKATFFTTELGGRRAQVQELLQSYNKISSRFTFRIVDPNLEPRLAEQYKLTQPLALFLEIEGASARQERVLEMTEPKITNALARLLSNATYAVYFLTGHGEKVPDDSGENGLLDLKAALEQERYTAKSLSLAEKPEIPTDAAVVVAVGPRASWFPPEEEAIGKFLLAGGRLFLLLDPESPASYARWLAAYGIALPDEIIVDQTSRLLGADVTVPLVTRYEAHPAVEGLRVMSFFPMARPVDAMTSPGGKKFVAQPLAKTSRQSWALKSSQVLGKEMVRVNPATARQGPIPVAAAVSESPPPAKPGENASQPKKPLRLVVFGDSDFVSKRFFFQAGNKDLFMNAVAWLAERGELIAIRPKDPMVQPVLLTEPDQARLFFLAMLFLPGLVVGTGFLACLNR